MFPYFRACYIASVHTFIFKSLYTYITIEICITMMKKERKYHFCAMKRTFRALQEIIENDWQQNQCHPNIQTQ